MCGRFTNQYSWRQLKELYDITTPYLTSNFPPRYNIAPTQMSFVVRLDKEGKRELVEMKWGLIPSWAKDTTGGARMINAKAETVAEKPAYRSAFLRRRCLVVADGFYEWKKISPKEKQPYFITSTDGKPFAFAGLYEWWKPNDGSALVESFTIITTTPNELCAPIHDRMPGMLAPENWAVWLGATGDHKALLKPFPVKDMQCWPVTKDVGSVKNTGPELVLPIGLSAVAKS